MKKPPSRHTWPGLVSTTCAMQKILSERLEWERAHPQKTIKGQDTGSGIKKIPEPGPDLETYLE
jgi:hypothetical protein